MLHDQLIVKQHVFSSNSNRAGHKQMVDQTRTYFTNQSPKYIRFDTHFLVDLVDLKCRFR